MRRFMWTVTIGGVLLLVLGSIDATPTDTVAAGPRLDGSEERLAAQVATRPPRVTVRSVEDVPTPTRTPTATSTPTATETSELVSGIIAPIVPAPMATETPQPAAAPLGGPPQALPNLTITDVRVAPGEVLIGAVPGSRFFQSASSFCAEAAIDSASVLEFLIRVYVDGEDRLVFNPGSADSAPGRHTYCLTVYGVSEGGHEVRFDLDSESQVAESDETDNTFAAIYTWSSPDGLALLPNLKVTSIGPADGTQLVAGPPSTVCWRLVNDTAVDVARAPWMEYFIDGDRRGGILGHQLPPAPFNVVICMDSVIAGAGPHEVEIRVDRDNDLAESDETDNTMTATLFWAPGLPDLRPTSTAFGDPDMDSDCDPGKNRIRQRIWNLGDDSGSFLVRILLSRAELDIDPDPKEGEERIDGLAAHARETVQFKKVKLKKDSYILEVTVDADQEVTEWDEENNVSLTRVECVREDVPDNDNDDDGDDDD